MPYTSEEMLLWGQLTNAGRFEEAWAIDDAVKARDKAAADAADAVYEAAQTEKELKELRAYKKKAEPEFKRANETFAQMKLEIEKLREQLARKEAESDRLAGALAERGHGGMVASIRKEFGR